LRRNTTVWSVKKPGNLRASFFVALSVPQVFEECPAAGDDGEHDKLEEDGVGDAAKNEGRGLSLFGCVGGQSYEADKGILNQRNGANQGHRQGTLKYSRVLQSESLVTTMHSIGYRENRTMVTYDAFLMAKCGLINAETG